MTVFVPGATGAVTTLEFEPGVVQDFRDLFDRIASARQSTTTTTTPTRTSTATPTSAPACWARLWWSPSTTASPAWAAGRRSVFVCFDNRPRERTVIVQTLGVR